MAKSNLIIKAAEIEKMEGDDRVHFLNPNARRIRKSLGDEVGLSHIGVHIIYVEPGREIQQSTINIIMKKNAFMFYLAMGL